MQSNKVKYVINQVFFLKFNNSSLFKIESVDNSGIITLVSSVQHGVHPKWMAARMGEGGVGRWGR